MNLDVEVDRDVCIGSGNCVYVARGVFDLDDDSIAVVIDVTGASEAEILAAARRCPARAITVRRDGDVVD